LAGLPSVLDNLPGFIETSPISVISATQDLTVRSPLTVPQNVVVVGVDFVTVTVEVLPILSSRAMTATVEIRGVNAGWVVTASPGVVDVILEGPDTLLTGLTADDVRVIIDVFGLDLGVHRVEPDVLAPEGVTVVSVIPETIEVVIAPGPTPEPSLTVTPTVTTTP
jgi:YbbR domain-containing protein